MKAKVGGMTMSAPTLLCGVRVQHQDTALSLELLQLQHLNMTTFNNITTLQQ
jgi:hypothetical protein